ncbi:hypothetical protein F7D25_15575 [Prevotella copri]|uniref:Uncharacterized protein n=1 Tax=Segatella copri TaxID=165179 RepID=A0A6G1VSG7_9BACT|nr:hypothetical protein [Segatella copri]MQP15788.1 hypothetical protein [Segatella copri]
MAKDNANTNIITLKNKYASITFTFYSSTNHWHYIYVKIRNLCCKDNDFRSKIRIFAPFFKEKERKRIKIR